MGNLDLYSCASCLLILIGMVIMLASIVKFSRIFSFLYEFDIENITRIKRFFVIHLCLMIFFVFGYLAVLLGILMQKAILSHFFVALVFFGGAVFVFLGVVLKDLFLSAILKSYEQIDNKVKERTRELETEQTRTRELVEKLEDKNRAISGYNRMIAHDLKNPLAAMSGFLQILAHKTDKSLNRDIQSSITEKSILIVDQMINTINQMLFYSCWDGKIKKDCCDLIEIIKTAESMLKNDIEKQNATIEYSLNVKNIFCDRTLMVQVFSNILSNSLKYSKKDIKPEITISSNSLEDGKVEITLKDNGIGIKEESLAAVFKEFSRVHEASVQAKGHGIGLNTCMRILESHEGSMSVQSEFGAFSIFTIILPDTC
ncbi:ATP-binding protein [Candidatus Riflebacteria bacterium]